MATGSRGTRIAKSSVGVSTALLGGAALEFARDIYIARSFGATEVTDAFFLAIVIPVVVGGALYNLSQITFLPWLAERHGSEELHERGAILFLATLPITIMLVAFSLPLSPLAARVLGGPAINATIFHHIMRYTLPSLGLLLQSNAMSAYLNARGLYTVAGVRRVVNHSTFLLSVTVLLPHWAPEGRLGAAFLAGYLVEYVYILAWSLHGLRPVHFKRSVHQWAPFRTTLRRAGWPALALAGARLNLVAERYVASYLGIGVVSVVSYTRRLMLAVGTITGQGINLVTLAEVARAREEERASPSNPLILNESLRLAALVLVPIGMAMLFLGHHVAELLFATRHFSSENLQLSGRLVRIYGVSLPLYVARPLLMTYFYAQGRTRDPSLLNLATVAFNLMAMLVAVWVIGPLGIGVAFAVAMAFGTGLAWYLAERQYGRFVAPDFVMFLGKVVTTGAVFGGAIYVAYSVLGKHIPWGNVFLSHVIAFSLAASLAAPVYLVGTCVLGIRETLVLVNWLQRRRGGRVVNGT